jgi:Double zinc ribbon
VFCIQCGTEALASARFCHSCGTSLPAGLVRTVSASPLTRTDQQEESSEARPVRVSPHTWRCSRCSKLNRPGTPVCECGQAYSVPSADESCVFAPHAPVREMSTPLRVIRLLIRIGAGTISFSLALMAGAIFKETNAPEDVAVALAFELGGGLIAFGVFFRWELTRVLRCGERRPEGRDAIRRHARLLGAILIGFGILGLMFSVIALHDVVGMTSVPPEVVFTIVLVISLTFLLGATGLERRREAAWARHGALMLAFVFFGGLPIGTMIAVDLWRFAASPFVRGHFQTLAARRVAAS